MKYIYLLLFYVLSYQSIKGQNNSSYSPYKIIGVVKDSVTGKAIENASIILDYKKLIYHAETNKNGQYSILVPSGEHILIIRNLGYRSFKKVVLINDAQTIVNAFLEPFSNELEEVVVTSKGFDNNIRQPILGVNQINISTLKKLPSALGEVDILRGLQMMPGVTSVGEASNGINIRGGTTDQSLILLDKAPIFNPTHMFGLFSVFPADAISGIDLYKGNIPARYSGRTASVLDISIQNPKLDSLRLSGSVSLVSTTLSLNAPIVKNKLGILLSGRASFNDFILPLISERLKNIKAQFGDIALKSFWIINDKNTISLTGYYNTDVFRTNLVSGLSNINSSSTQYNFNTLNTTASWTHIFNKKLNLQTSAVYSYYSPKILLTELKSSNEITLESSIVQTQFLSNLNYQTEKQKIEFGVSGTQYRIKPGTLFPGKSTTVNYLTTPTENAFETGIYIDNELSITKKLAVSFGLRYSYYMAVGPSLVRNYFEDQPIDDFSVKDTTSYNSGEIIKSYGGFEPRIGIRYELNTNSSVKFGYNIMRQYLQQVTNTTTPLPTARWKTSDTHIAPQISELLSVGYFKNFTDNIYELSLEGYSRTTINIIDYKPGADFLLQPYPETQLLQGINKSYGVEFMISKKKGQFKGWINYTYSRSLNQVYNGASIQENINNGEWYSANYDKPHTLNSSFTIDVNKHNSFGLTFTYSTGRPYSSPQGYIYIQGSQFPYYNDRNNSRLPDYHRLDFSWNIYNPSTQKRRWEGSWVINVYNIYGRGNVYSAFFRTEEGLTNGYKLQIFAVPMFSISYKFVFK